MTRAPGLLNVPRGTETKLEALAGAVLASPHNLIAPTTRAEIWHRHIADSVQLIDHVPQGRRWLDIGSGGGFPGLVLAALRWGEVHLVESIGKKVRFLRDTALALELDCEVHHGRVERLDLPPPDVITARAVASITRLLGWTRHLWRCQPLYLLPKGRNWRAEVDEARADWRFDMEQRPSLTDPEAAILLLRHPRAR